MKVKGMASLDGTDNLVEVEVEITDPKLIALLQTGRNMAFSISEVEEQNEMAE